MAVFLAFPSLAPYEAAQRNGTVAFLPADRIRLCNRLAVARDVTAGNCDAWFNSIAALESFQQRFVVSEGTVEGGAVVTAPDIGSLSSAELTEYLGHLSVVIQDINILSARIRHPIAVIKPSTGPRSPRSRPGDSRGGRRESSVD